MKLLGIDYGEAKVGLALGDTESQTALPFQILKNNGRDNLMAEFKKICQQEQVEKIIVGLPLNHQTQSSKQIDLVNDFIRRLAGQIGVSVETQDEQLTTRQARRLAPNGDEDDVAAMLILQAYLDKFLKF